MQIVSDPHNFNRKCYFQEGFVTKHRSLFPEQRLLGAGSSFRSFLSILRGGEFKVLPLLQFIDVKTRATLDEQKMEFITVSEIERRLSDSEIFELGEIYGILTALGVSDLHIENVIFGTRPDGSICFAPIDLEVFYSDFSGGGLGLLPQPRDTYLLTSLAIFSTYRTNFPDPDFSCKMFHGYRSILELIEQNQKEFYSQFWGGISPEAVPVRVMFNQTRRYNQLLLKKEFEDCIPEETDQLLRGDIPYFFTFLGDLRAHYWKSSSQMASLSPPKPILGFWPRHPEAYELSKARKSIHLFMTVDRDLGHETTTSWTAVEFLDSV